MKSHTALENLANQITEAGNGIQTALSQELEALSHLKDQIARAVSFDNLLTIIGTETSNGNPRIGNAEVKTLIKRVKNQFTAKAQAENLKRLEEILHSSPNLSPQVEPTGQADLQPFDKYPITEDQHGYPVSANINLICSQYGQLYELKPGRLPETFRWAPDEAERKRLQTELLAIQDEVVAYYLSEMNKLGTNANNINLYIQNSEVILDKVAVSKPVFKIEKVFRIFYDLRGIVQLRHQSNERLTTNLANHQKLPVRAIEDITKIKRIEEEYVRDLEGRITAQLQKISQAINIGSPEMTGVINDRINCSTSKRHRLEIIRILNLLINQITITSDEYLHLEKYLVSPLKDNILVCAKQMVRVEPGPEKIDAAISSDLTNFTAASLLHLIQSITPHIEELTLNLQTQGQYTPDQRLTLSRLMMYLLARFLPSLAIVSQEYLDPQEYMSYRLFYQGGSYQVIDLLAGRYNHIPLFEEISGQYLALLAGLKRAAQTALNDFVKEINQDIINYKTRPSPEHASTLVAHIYAHKAFTIDYRAVFHDDEMDFLIPFEYEGTEILDQEGILLKLFSDYEKQIKYQMANNRFDHQDLITACQGFSSLRWALCTSGNEYSFHSQLNRSVQSIQAFAYAKKRSDLHCLGVADQVYSLSRLHALLKFDQIVREGLAEILGLVWGTKDELMQDCIDRMISNPKLSDYIHTRVTADEMQGLIKSQPYQDTVVQAIHLQIFNKDNEKLQSLNLEKFIVASANQLSISKIWQSAILSILNNFPKIREIDFGRFIPDSAFLSKLMNRYETIHCYRYSQAINNLPSVRKGIHLTQLPQGSGFKIHRTRLANGAVLEKNGKIKEKTKTNPTEQGQLYERLKGFYVACSMNVRDVFIALQGDVSFDDFQAASMKIYEAQEAGEQFAVQMVSMACEEARSVPSDRLVRISPSLVAAFQWLEKIPRDSEAFIRSAYQLFMVYPVDVSSGLDQLWDDFAQALAENATVLLHTDYEKILHKLSTFPMYSPTLLKNVFGSYLRSFELLNEYNNEEYLSAHYVTLKKYLCVSQIIFPALRREPVFASDFSYSYLAQQASLPAEKLSLVAEVNKGLVANIESDFNNSRFDPDFKKFSLDLAILTHNYPLNNAIPFILGINHYLRTWASTDLGFQQRMGSLINQPVLSKSKIPSQYNLLLLEAITDLPVQKLKSVTNEIIHLFSLFQPDVQLDDSDSASQDSVSDFDQQMMKFKAMVLENKIKNLYPLIRDDDHEWTDSMEDERLPEALAPCHSSIKMIYLYFCDKKEVSESSSSQSDYFNQQYTSLFKQLGKLNIIMSMLENVRKYPTNNHSSNRQQAYAHGIDQLRLTDTNPVSFAKFGFRRIVHHDTAMVKAVKLLRNWNQNDNFDQSKANHIILLHQTLKSHYASMLEQLVHLYLRHLPADPQYKTTDLTRLSAFLGSASSAVRDEQGTWSSRLLVQARATSSYAFGFGRPIDKLFQHLSEHPELLIQSNNAVLRRLKTEVDGLLTPVRASARVSFVTNN